ncbi:MAG TPA: 50S ribosomal protein L6 [Gammaproteobacteria bacterium]|nr:50S ribosomal protein L6 [Gammaproteobacteria bacterium]
MSRVAKNPVVIPAGVEFGMEGDEIVAKGPRGALTLTRHPLVKIEVQGQQVLFSACDDSKTAGAMSGTMRALVQNAVIGVHSGFEKRLKIIGVGYRAKVQGSELNLTLGFSHPVLYKVPEGIVVETPTPTEIVIKGVSKQQVGQAAANIRHYRPPEPYKGKGVRYVDEHVVRKQAKKK